MAKSGVASDCSFAMQKLEMNRASDSTELVKCDSSKYGNSSEPAHL